MTRLQSVRADDQLGELASAPPGEIDVAPLLGTWWATDKATDSVVRLELADRAGSFVVHAFGACTPAPCDWGERAAVPYAATVSSRDAMAFSAVYDFGFMETLLAAYMKGGILVLDTFNAFKDGSGRASYFTREFFHR
jgi:hypothetical protein